MDGSRVHVKQEADGSQPQDSEEVVLNDEEYEREQENESDGESVDDGLVSFYENQNMLDTYFDQSEAQELRDLGVSLVDADEVSNTIFEQVKSHFKASKEIQGREGRRRRRMRPMSLSTSASSGESLLGSSDGSSGSTLIKSETVESPNLDDSDSRAGGESLLEPSQEQESESIVELESIVQGELEVKDDLDSERYNRRVLRSGNQMNTGQDGSNEGDSGPKTIRVSRDSDSNQLFIWDKIWRALYPHQKEGVLWMWGLYCNNHGGILADEMGLGKSITAASFIAALFITFQRNHGLYFGGGTDTSIVKAQVKHESDQDLGLGSVSIKCDQEVPRVRLCSESNYEVNSCRMVLLVLPATLISHWIEVFNKWYYPIRIILFHGKGETERRVMFNKLREIERVSTELLVITTYETLRRNLQTLRQINWFYIILDEGHKIRNPDSGITLAVKSLGTCNRLLLSGSPIQNDLKELWSLIDFVYPGRLGTLPVFEQQFVLPIKQAELRNAAKVQTMRALNCTRILQELIKACILRRRKHELQDILKLPSQAEHVLFCSLTSVQYDVYCRCLDLLQAKQLSKNKMHGISKYFALLNILREACNHPELLKLIRRQSKDSRMDLDLDYYDDQDDEVVLSGGMSGHQALVDEESQSPSSQRFINVNGGDSGKYQALMSILKLWRDKKEHRVLIFTQGVRTLKLLSRLLEKDLGLVPNKDVLTLDGSTPLNTRFSLVKRFNQDSSIFLFILTSRVGGVGLNIIGANRVILYDPWWNPMTDVQAKERCWRIGQKKEVIVYRLITRDTIEERIFQRQLFKEFIAKQILKDPKSQSSLNWTNFNELIRKPRKPKNYSSNPRLASDYVRNIKNIWGAKTRQRRDGNTYSSYFDDLEPSDGLGLDEYGNHRSGGLSPKKELINDELNLFGEITCDAKSEHNAIMSILGDHHDDHFVSNSIGSSSTGYLSSSSRPTVEGATCSSGDSFHNDLVDATDEIIRTSVELIKQSEIERGSYDYDVPTWTGKSGQAGAPSSFILRNLKRQKLSQGGGCRVQSESADLQQTGGWDEGAIRRRLAEYFLKRERLGIRTSTDDLLGSFGELIPDSSHGLFRKILKQMCTLKKSGCGSSKENYWVLKRGAA
ncbi:Swi/SNf2 RAD26 [Cryptosporidium canis]|uniref:Swi/SNf2 RAD26 n=1 Tax=Cryptosporidium canis TaxID=195482 RepID=A0ABQ8P8P5_9CRYT|nr:Swi/SNf2 RAD26 [Cryptosporidium canis]